MGWRLIEPGARKGNRFYLVRGSENGSRFEVSSGTTDRATAEEFARRFVFAMKVHESAGGDRRIVDAAIPKPPNRFERFLLFSFELQDGAPVDRETGKPLRPRVNARRGGYVQYQVRYGPINRLVYAHRLVFLLKHGWLPPSVDHIDRNPGNNRPENLRAASPREQFLNSDAFGRETGRGKRGSNAGKPDK